MNLRAQNTQYLATRLRVRAPPVAELKNKKLYRVYSALPTKMSRWLSPHPDGWDVKPEVPGDLASRGICLFQTLVSHNSGKPGRVVQFQFHIVLQHYDIERTFGLLSVYMYGHREVWPLQL